MSWLGGYWQLVPKKAAAAETRTQTTREGQSSSGTRDGWFWRSKRRVSQQDDSTEPAKPASGQSRLISAPAKPRETSRSYGQAYLSGQAYAHLGDNISYHMTDSSQAAREHEEEKRLATLIDSLTFTRMGARERNVALASPTTCEWIFSDPHFQAWADEKRMRYHHGFLWIKGKPGSGKSTMMKHIKAWAVEQWPEQVVISYFFNARSDVQLEKSTEGLWRSLAHQLLEARALDRSLFRNTFAAKLHGDEIDTWEESELRNYVIDMICNHCQKPLNIFIDALDEGYDDEVQRLVLFLEDFAFKSDVASKSLRLCLSSRHYPHIQIRRGVSLILEDQPGHRRDIEKYLDRYLHGDTSEVMHDLRTRVFVRSQGVFLWVVLVVPILNTIYNQGKSTNAMLEKLEGVPDDLHQLFALLLSREPAGFHDTVSLLRWVFHAVEPLKPSELFIAIAHRHTSVYDDAEKLPDQSVVQRYLLHCSRGLVESTSEDEPKVQFIHQTVREYLRNTSAKGESIELSFEAGACHTMLAETCLQYLLRLFKLRRLEKGVPSQLQLAKYAARHWWKHLMRSTEGHHNRHLLNLASQIINDDYTLSMWTRLSLDPSGVRILGAGVEYDLKRLQWRVISHAASVRFWDLVEILLKVGVSPNAPLVGAETRKSPLWHAVSDGNETAVLMLLQYETTVDVSLQCRDDALYVASSLGHESVAKALNETGADVRRAKMLADHPLSRAAEFGHEELVKILLATGDNF